MFLCTGAGCRLLIGFSDILSTGVVHLNMDLD